MSSGLMSWYRPHAKKKCSAVSSLLPQRHIGDSACQFSQAFTAKAKELPISLSHILMASYLWSLKRGDIVLQVGEDLMQRFRNDLS